MSRGGARRRLRVRRKRRGEGLGPEAVGLAADAAVQVAAGAAEGAVEAVAGAAVEGGTEVVAEFGCCLVEAVGAVSVLAALLFVPVFFLMS